MSRSNYTDDCENLALWRGSVASAIRGKRGQNLLRDMAAAMDAMPVKELIAYELVDWHGHHCALGVVGAVRGLDMGYIDQSDGEAVARKFDIAYALACEIAYINDEDGPEQETREARWHRVRKWVAEQIADSK